MSDAATSTERHPGEDALIRVLDGEEDDPSVREHIEACEECRLRYEQLAAWSEGVSESLEVADPVVRERDQKRRSEPGGAGGVPRWLKVAAAILLVLSGTLAVEPVRAWVLSQAESVARRLGIGAATSGTPDRAAPRSASLSFVPAGSELVIRFENSQQAGRLIVATRAESMEVDVSVLGTAGSGPTELTVLPSQLSIGNDPTSRADYRVVVPSTIDVVEVKVGDSVVARVSAEELQSVESWTLDLEPGTTGDAE